MFTYLFMKFMLFSLIIIFENINFVIFFLKLHHSTYIKYIRLINILMGAYSTTCIKVSFTLILLKRNVHEFS